MVAVMDLRVGWLFHSRLLHLLDRPHRRNVPYRISRHCSIFIWYLGLSLACFQQSSDGLRLVRCSGVDWRYVLDAPSSCTRKLTHREALVSIS